MKSLSMLLFIPFLSQAYSFVEPTFESLVSAPTDGEEKARELVLEHIIHEGDNVHLGDSVPLMGYGYGSMTVGYAFLGDSSKEEILSSWEDFHILKDLIRQLNRASSRKQRWLLDHIYNEIFKNMSEEERLYEYRRGYFNLQGREVTFAEYFHGESGGTFNQIVDDKKDRLRLYIVAFIKDGPVLVYAYKLPRSVMQSPIRSSNYFTIKEKEGSTYLGYTLSYEVPWIPHRCFPNPQYYQLHMTYEKEGRIFYNTYEAAMYKPLYSPDIPVLISEHTSMNLNWWHELNP